MQQFLKIIICGPSLYAMIRPDFIVCSFMGIALVCKDEQYLNVKINTVKHVLSSHSKASQRLDFKIESLNAAQKMQIAARGHSAILLTCIKLSYAFTTFVFPFSSGLLKTGFTV